MLHYLEVETFCSGEVLCEHILAGKTFDLLFLALESHEMNGLAVGKKIREELDEQRIQIVYLSDQDSCYKEIFDVRPMHCLSKPLEESKIITDIILGMKLSNVCGQVFTYKKGHAVCRAPLKKILYFEAQKRRIKMVTIDGEIEFYKNMHEVVQQVQKYRFFPIHKSFVVNYDHIVKLNSKEVEMSNQAIIPISRQMRKSIEEIRMRLIKEYI